MPKADADCQRHRTTATAVLFRVFMVWLFLRFAYCSGEEQKGRELNAPPLRHLEAPEEKHEKPRPIGRALLASSLQVKISRFPARPQPQLRKICLESFT